MDQLEFSNLLALALAWATVAICNDDPSQFRWIPVGIVEIVSHTRPRRKGRSRYACASDICFQISNDKPTRINLVVGCKREQLLGLVAEELEDQPIASSGG